MIKVLGRKQSGNNDAWRAVFSGIEKFVSYDEVQRAAEAVLHEMRFVLAGYQRPIFAYSGGKVPVGIVDHQDRAQDMYGTITHNRARGTHVIGPMKGIVKQLLSEGKSYKAIEKQTGMKPEEIFRLSDFTREEFLTMMAGGQRTYSKAKIIARM